jgi:cytidylate kinase
MERVQDICEVSDMICVTISRHFGAGGHSLAEKLCERFGFHLVDDSVVEKLAIKHKLSPNWLNTVEKEASSTLLSILSSTVSRGLFYRTPGSMPERDERKKYISFLADIFKAMATGGGYVIVGRGAQFILKGHPRTIHVLLVAEYESRVDFLVTHHQLSRSEAASMIRDREKKRTTMASCLFNADIDDPSLYHIVLNTSLIPYECVLEAVSGLVNRFIERQSSPSFKTTIRGMELKAIHDG